jgi:TetR/AcrR family fatty acid metabolism transcriptional regulator
MSPRPDVSEERKNQILEAATAVFARLGFHKARMDDIVDESGLSKGSLYWYFNSKDEIILAILNRMFERELSDLKNLPDMPGSAAERLERMVERAIVDIQGMLKLMPLAFEFLYLAFRRKIVQQALSQYVESYLALATPVIQQGIDRGEFHPVDVEQTALAIFAIIEGSAMMWVYAPERVQTSQLIRFGTQRLLDGLKVD